MKKTSIWLSLLCFLMISQGLLAQDVVGFWKTINDKTGKAQSIIAIYEYQGKYYGRIVVTYDEQEKVRDSIEDPKDRAPGVEGNPFYSGLDIMWNLQHKGDKYVDGKILDPQKGKIYDSEMWTKDGKLIVRGKIWVFGANQEWLPAQEKDFPPGFKKPDLTKMVPTIPHVKKNASKAAETTSKK